MEKYNVWENKSPARRDLPKTGLSPVQEPSCPDLHGSRRYGDTCPGRSYPRSGLARLGSCELALALPIPPELGSTMI